MKDDYLWDKTGEPDLEIEHLERVLGQLRHKRTARDFQPELEKTIRPEPRLFKRMLALAAALVFVAFALGTWLALRQFNARRTAPVVAVKPEPKKESTDQSPAKAQEPKLVPDENNLEQNNSDAERRVAEASGRIPKSNDRARRANIRRRREASREEIEQARGETAKNQLIKALQITTSKLDFVHRKVQGDRETGPSS